MTRITVSALVSAVALGAHPFRAGGQTAGRTGTAEATTTAPLRSERAGGWNDPAVLALVRRARVRRHATGVDTSFRSYSARARGYVYFFFDRRDSDQRTLVKADQVALEVYWKAPNHTKQRIVGLRDRKVLPTSIRYHLDHLTVVQDDFADLIRIGDGDEVAAVLHPIGPNSEAYYDFRLADSLSVRYGGNTDEVRVYEVQVRPKDLDGPGFLGSVYLDRATAAIVRMTFTFTPASYVDPYLDHIRISLDNSRWLGRYWLPYRQEIEIRREIPQLDFLAGGVIRGKFEIGGYTFNQDLPDALFAGRRVSTVAPEARKNFPFEKGLFDEVEEEGLNPSPSLEAIQAEVMEVVRQRYLSGLSRARASLGSFSDVLRYDRAEGLFLGAGISALPSEDVMVRVRAGYRFDRSDVFWKVTATGGTERITPRLEIVWNELRDLGPYPGASGAVNTLGALFASQDFIDPFFARGVRLTFSAPHTEGPSLTTTLTWERHRSAENVLSGPQEPSGFRPVRPVDEGILGSVSATLASPGPWGSSTTLSGEWGRFETHNFATLLGKAEWSREELGGGWGARADLSGGVASAGTPVQRLFLLGGRNTLPGHGYREFVGDGFWLARAEGSHPLLQPWVGLRAFAALGRTYLSRHAVPTGWRTTPSDGIRASVGLGLTLAWDVLRLDLGRGLNGGDWELTFSVDARFHPWL